ncbi:histidine kinase [Azospirillum baldaniorum]|uniref:sensor histidine kinase n=1 Tax=Azospirillum baldaniorum TaxID=1064539 RepID=UPI000B4929A5|nr:CHASE domain-containing protein [Azospirillum baldaniorum]AWJ89128.1 histidine kinase [Azospirillum baldaniorum]TWA80700.1 PAS domain S-box-containing protein [Azospirillum brasilense]
MALLDRRRRGSFAVPVLVAAGLTLTFGAFFQMRAANREAERAQHERQFAQFHDALTERIGSHTLLLRTLGSAFSDPRPATRDGFAAAVRPIMPLYPGLWSVAWVTRVSSTEVPALEAAMRAAGRRDFTVRNANGTGDGTPGPAPAAGHGDLFVNTLVEPERGEAFGQGINILSLPNRAEVLARACASGDLTATEALPPRPRGETGRSIGLYLPVYRYPVDEMDGADRCAEVAGYVSSVFGITRLLEEAGNRVDGLHGAVHLLDGPAGGGGRVLASRDLTGASESREGAPFGELREDGDTVLERDLVIGGRRWTLALAIPPEPRLAPEDYPAWTVLVMGLLLTGALAGYTRREAQAKRFLVTEARARAAMARALRESEERFRMALRHSRVAVFSLDRSLRYMWMYNPQTGRAAETFIGRTNADIHAPDDAARLDAVKRAVLDSGTGARQEVRVGAAPGAEQVFDLIVEPLRDEAGVVSGVICAAIDISDGVRIREALAEAHAEAERANRAKSRFLAAASHDLRQPFQAMSLFHHILSARLSDAKQMEVADKLGEAIAAGNTLLNTLLDTSALEAGNVKPRPTVFPFQDIADRLNREFAEQAASKGMVLRMVPTSAYVLSDPVLLERMVRNLLVNALRYAGTGTILLGCRHRDGHALVEVWDTGPGIPADQLKLIFDDFYRCGTDQRDSGRGLGLGLSIVRRTAQILGHQVDVRSRVGKGTVFSISVLMIGDRHNPLPEEPTTSVASA